MVLHNPIFPLYFILLSPHPMPGLGIGKKVSAEHHDTVGARLWGLCGMVGELGEC